MQNFGGKNFDNSTCIRQIRQTFLSSKFYAIRYYVTNFIYEIEIELEFKEIHILQYYMKHIVIYSGLLYCYWSLSELNIN